MAGGGSSLQGALSFELLSCELSWSMEPEAHRRLFDRCFRASCVESRRVASLVGAEPRKRVIRLVADSSQRRRSGVPYAEAVEVGLCFGWIDSQMAKGAGRLMEEAVIHAAHKQKQLVDVERVQRLIASGEMQPAGMRQVEAAKADGRWDA